MQLQRKEGIVTACLKSLSLFIALWLVVLLVNYPIISFDMMYEEQPILYLVNQKIHSLHDLLQVYLHPAMLEAFAIPFFRPSGHFLVYQVITLFLDWHNTKGFLVVNFFFLALTCYMMIRLYALLFPHYRAGAYIACGVYLLHPALALSRLTPMHFEFACVFFSMWSLYCFALFCQKNKIADQNQIQFTYQYMLVLSIALYFVSVTFKETALMLAPVMLMYFCISSYGQQTSTKTLTLLLRNSEVRRIFLLMTVIAITLAIYLSMAWPSLTHPSQHAEPTGSPFVVLITLFKMLSGFWSNVTFPPLAQWTMRILSGVLLLCVWFIYTKKQNAGSLTYRKSFLFLAVTMLAFMVMPILWGRGRPWHLALSLVFFSLMIGFCIDYLCHYLLHKKRWINVAEIAIGLSLGLIAFSVACSNVNYFETDNAGFAARIDRNAILHPPAIQNQLNAGSVIVVEDSIVHNDYLLGDSVYPVEPFVENGIDMHRLLQGRGFYEFPYIYGGTLFKWAYLMPTLKEQVYLFQIDKMQAVPGITVYNWLQHFDNIFCLGYDSIGKWHDRTMAFKKNLLLEKARRHLTVNHYKILPTKTFAADKNSVVRLPFADVGYCQFRCDANKSCQGFTYVQSGIHGEVTQCYFSSADRKPETSTCETCQSFIKIT